MKEAKEYEKFLNKLDSLTSKVLEARRQTSAEAIRITIHTSLERYEASVVGFCKSLNDLRDFCRDTYLARREDE